ncbi:MAG: PQQ-dependent sugar dehydrogenase [Granulosicoccus sp.]|nr:PQQ-dependent sugar dehydrogenase [Granulosicoccus sp.]
MLQLHVLLLTSFAAHAIELPDGFVDEPVIGGISGQLVAFDQSPNGAIYLAEKSGLIRVWRDGLLLDNPFLDISEQVNDRVDRGLLGLALHPQFPDVPYIYVAFTFDPPELAALEQDDPGRFDGNGNRVARIARYTADAAQNHERAVVDSEFIVLGKNSTYANIGDPEGLEDSPTPSCGAIGAPVTDCLPIDEVTHTIGSLRFAPDGSLVITNGDGASYRATTPVAYMVQDLNSLRGKILRVDPQTGLGLSDNPFFNGDAQSNQSRVLSFGMRNPYSLAIHPTTGEPFVGDVGWKQWEDIHGGSGKNFGWPCYEGNNTGNLRHPEYSLEPYCVELYNTNPEISRPIDSWLRDTTGAAMVGDFYKGSSFPEIWHGKLFYFDFLKGWMRAIDVYAENPDNAIDFASEIPTISHMLSAEDGALYYANLTAGEVRRIRYTLEPDSESHPSTFASSSGSSGSGGFSAGLIFLFCLIFVSKAVNRQLHVTAGN